MHTRQYTKRTEMMQQITPKKNKRSEFVIVVTYGRTEVIDQSRIDAVAPVVNCFIDIIVTIVTGVGKE
jgi:hypothetical protein